MQNPRLAARYAKSLIDLAVEKNELEQVNSDMQYLRAVCKASREFVSVLRSPVIRADQKTAILGEVFKNGVKSELTTAFSRLLLNKSREANLPDIIEAFEDQYNAIKGIRKVKITTATPVDASAQEEIISRLKKESNGGFDKIQLEAAVDEELIGGFVLEFNNNVVDLSIQRDLRDIKKQFTKNIFVSNIR